MSFLRTSGIVLWGAMALCATSPHVDAGEPPATRPALDELNREIHALYEQTQGSLLPMQLPRPQWIREYTNEPINKYSQLDPAVKQQLSDDQRKSSPPGGNQITARVYSNGGYTIRSQGFYSNSSAGTQPSATQPGTIIIVRPQSQQQSQRPTEPGGAMQMKAVAQGEFLPTHVGIALDKKGYVLVPIYVERETCQSHPIRLSNGNGQVLEATFVGSDRQTNLTVVHVDPASGKPTILGDPVDPGSVCLFVSPVDGAARLGVWTAGQADWGYVFATDGHLAGVARGGQIVSGSACQVIAGEIERYGMVRRPTLGVKIAELLVIDPARNQRRVMRVEDVAANSAADKAGLKSGDILVSFRGQPITDVSSLAAAMAACDGKTVLQIMRNDEPLTLSVELTLPTPDANAVNQTGQQPDKK